VAAPFDMLRVRLTAACRRPVAAFWAVGARASLDTPGTLPRSRAAAPPVASRAGRARVGYRKEWPAFRSCLSLGPARACAAVRSKC